MHVFDMISLRAISLYYILAAHYCFHDVLLAYSFNNNKKRGGKKSYFRSLNFIIKPLWGYDGLICLLHT